MSNKKKGIGTRIRNLVKSNPNAVSNTILAVIPKKTPKKKKLTVGQVRKQLKFSRNVKDMLREGRIITELPQEAKAKEEAPKKEIVNPLKKGKGEDRFKRKSRTD
jgi:hypothetical protein